MAILIFLYELSFHPSFYLRVHLPRTKDTGPQSNNFSSPQTLQHAQFWTSVYSLLPAFTASSTRDKVCSFFNRSGTFRATGVVLTRAARKNGAESGRNFATQIGRCFTHRSHRRLGRFVLRRACHIRLLCRDRFFRAIDDAPTGPSSSHRRDWCAEFPKE
jgi:hypothetical protein